jgi:hypothetical protein
MEHQDTVYMVKDLDTVFDTNDCFDLETFPNPEFIYYEYQEDYGQDY